MNPQDRIQESFSLNDHNVLIEIKTELKLFREESRAINNDTKERLVILGENKLEKETFNTFLEGYKIETADKETRVRFLEKYAWIAIGIIGVSEIIIGWYIKTKK